MKHTHTNTERIEIYDIAIRMAFGGCPNEQKKTNAQADRQKIPQMTRFPCQPEVAS